MKIQHLFYAFLILSFLTVSSCKKDDPLPETGASAGTPVFSCTGTMDGAPFTLEAGGNDYFMSTSSEVDANGVTDFIGELKPQNCTSNCGGSLKISIKDYRSSLLSPTNIDSSIVPGFYSFATPLGASSQFSNTFYSSLQNGIAQSYTWDFGDGTTGTYTSSTVTHLYTHPGVYKVSLTILSTGGCSSTIANEIQFGQTGNAFLPQFQTTISGDVATFIPIPIGGIPPFTYAWDFGDGSVISTETSPSHRYTSPGVYKASLTMTDLVGTSAIQYVNVSINSGSANNTDCSSRFIFPAATPLGNLLNLSNVVVEWTDTDGRVWTSNNNSQSSSRSMFRIISVTDYISNQNGEPTKKIHAKFSCTLYNGFRSINMSDVETIFAVAHK